MPPLPLKGSPDNNNDDEQHNNNNQNHNKDQAIRNKPVLSEMIKSGLTGCEMSPKRNKPINSSESAINNNSPGRLKIYREGKCLLELVHREARDGDTSVVWEPITNNVFWPPAEVPKSETPFSQQDAASDRTSSPRSEVSETVIEHQQQQQMLHRAKSKPKVFRTSEQPEDVLDNLSFCMRPPEVVRIQRKKMRKLNQKCRRPNERIFVAAYLTKFQPGEAANPRPRTKTTFFDRIAQSSRLERNVAKLSDRSKQNVKKPIVNIQAWSGSGVTKPAAAAAAKSVLSRFPGMSTTIKSEKSTEIKRTSKEKQDLASKRPSPFSPMKIHAKTQSVDSPRSSSDRYLSPKTGLDRISSPKTSLDRFSSPTRAPGVTRIKTELCQVREVFSASTMPTPPPKSASKISREKSEDRKNLKLTPHKALPVTPMKAQVRHQLPVADDRAVSGLNSSSSVMSSDMHRVKVEIGRQASPLYRYSPVTSSASNLSQAKTYFDQRNQVERIKLGGSESLSTSSHQSLTSPHRYPVNLAHKRILDETDTSAPIAKRHRLSLDSRLVGLTQFQQTLQHHHQQQQQQQLHQLHRASPQPNRRASFSIDSIINKSQDKDYLDRTSLEPHQQLIPVLPMSAKPKISVPITPYEMRGRDLQPGLDARLAHLAGVSANPHLGLSHVGYMGNPFYAQYLAMVSQLGQGPVPGGWNPPPPTSQTPSGLSQSTCGATPSPPVTQTIAATPSPPLAQPFNGWSSERALKPDEDETMDSTTSDLPLNLCTKK